MAGRYCKGLSLIEVLVVVAIISVLLWLISGAYIALTTQARYARWAAYSNSLRVDEDLVAYWTFDRLDGKMLPNQASGVA